MNLSSALTYSVSLKMHEYQIDCKISVQFLLNFTKSFG